MEIERTRIHLLSEVVAAVAALMMKSWEVLLSFEVCGRNPLVLPFFSAVLSPGAICFYSVSEHEICQFFRILFLATSGSERLNILNYFTIRDHKVLLIFASW